MQFFPEFACMVQRWSGQNKFQSLHGWARIAYAIRSQRYMKCMGAKVSFMDVVYHLRGDEENEENPGLVRQATLGSVDNTRVCEMNYAEFHSKFADTLRTFDHLDPLYAAKKQKRGLSTKINKVFGVSKSPSASTSNSANSSERASFADALASTPAVLPVSTDNQQNV